MPLVGSTEIEAYTGLATADAVRVARFAAQAERYLRRAKGTVWYDAILAVEEPAAGTGTGGVSAPTVTLLSPANGTTVTTPVKLEGAATDDTQVERVEWRWDGGPWRTVAIPYPYRSVTFLELLDLPETGGAATTLDVRVTDADGNTDLASAVIEIAGIAGRAGEAVPMKGGAGADAEVAFQAQGAGWLARQRAERAESLLALYYAVPHLNLRLDAAGGIVTTIWSDLGGGTKQQTAFARFDSLDRFRSELKRQAKLLVDADVRVAYDGAGETALVAAVEDFGGGGGFLGGI